MHRGRSYLARLRAPYPSRVVDAEPDSRRRIDMYHANIDHYLRLAGRLIAVALVLAVLAIAIVVAKVLT